MIWLNMSAPGYDIRFLVAGSSNLKPRPRLLICGAAHHQLHLRSNGKAYLRIPPPFHRRPFPNIGRSSPDLDRRGVPILGLA